MTQDKAREAFEKYATSETRKLSLDCTATREQHYVTWQAATASARAEYLPVVENMYQTLLLAQPCVKPMRIQAVEAQIEKSLALAAPLLRKDTQS